MSNFNFEYMGDYLQYKDSQGNTLIVNGGIINETATGAVAEFTDGAENIPVKSLTVTTEPIQDLHGQDAPWPAGGGKNIFNYDAWKGVTIARGTAIFENNGITITAEDNDAYTSYVPGSYPNLANIPVSEGETITLAWEESTNTRGQVFIFPNGISILGVNVYNSERKYVSYTVASDITFITIRFGVSNAGDTIAYKNIQVVKGTTVPTWSPYSNICPISGHSTVNIWREATYDTGAEPVISIQLGDTIYGGTVDVISGVLTVNMAMVDMGILSWNLITVAQGNLFRATVEDIKQAADSLNLISECYATVTSSNRRNYTISKSTGKNIDVIDNSYSDAVSFKVAMDGVQLVYELAQPIKIQLTPEQLTTLLGTNYIWSDADSVSVDYVADTKLYIQNAISDSV